MNGKGHKSTGTLFRVDERSSRTMVYIYIRGSKGVTIGEKKWEVGIGGRSN